MHTFFLNDTETPAKASRSSCVLMDCVGGENAIRLVASDHRGLYFFMLGYADMTLMHSGAFLWLE